MEQAKVISDQERWLGVIGRALSYLCIHSTELREADLPQKALLLESFGVPRRDVAEILRTTEDSVRVSVNAEKRKRKSRGAKRK